MALKSNPIFYQRSRVVCKSILIDSLMYGGKDRIQTVLIECMIENYKSIFDKPSTSFFKAVILCVAFDACWSSRIWSQDLDSD